MEWARPGLLLGLMAVCCFAPGYALVRRLGKGGCGVETLCLSVAGSLGVLYGVGFGLRVAEVPIGWAWVMPVISVGVLWKYRKDLVAWWPSVRAVVVAYAVMVLWAGLMLCVVRHYGGGNWSGDWEEHYQRAMFFVEHWPTDYRFIDRYELPARPPLVNAVMGVFMGMVGKEFWVFQWASAVLAATVYLPVRWLAGERATWPAALVLACSPFVAQNVVYPWTKLEAVLLFLVGVGCYLKAWENVQRPTSNVERSREMAWAAGIFALAILAHYSAGPYVLMVGAHYLLVVWRGRWRELVRMACVGAIVLATWLGWAVFVYGPERTARAQWDEGNAGSDVGLARRVAGNLWNSAVPVVIRNPDALKTDPDLEQRGTLGELRQAAFVVYQMTAGAIGMGGLVVVAGAIAGRVGERNGSGLARRPLTPTLSRKGRGDRSTATFGIMVVLGGFLIGVAAHPVVLPYGVVHVVGQVAVVMTLVWVVRSWGELSAKWRAAVVIGGLVDFALGVGLHVWMEGKTMRFTKVPGGLWEVVEAEGLGHAAEFNALVKMLGGYRFWGDVCAGWQTAGVVALGVFVVALAYRTVRVDSRLTHTGD